MPKGRLWISLDFPSFPYSDDVCEFSLSATWGSIQSNTTTFILWSCFSAWSFYDCYRSSYVASYRCQVSLVSQNVQRTPSGTQPSLSGNDCFCLIHCSSFNYRHNRALSRKYGKHCIGSGQVYQSRCCHSIIFTFFSLADCTSEIKLIINSFLLKIKSIALFCAPKITNAVCEGSTISSISVRTIIPSISCIANILLLLLVNEYNYGQKSCEPAQIVCQQLQLYKH